jgi:uncharacterized protein YciI
MPFFVVTMTHPDGDGWNLYAKPHVEYLLKLVEKKLLKASGPLKGLPLRAGFLIIIAEDRAEVETIVAEDPFAKQDLIVELTILEWDPLFGAFEKESSRTVPPNWLEQGSQAKLS